MKNIFIKICLIIIFLPKNSFSRDTKFFTVMLDPAGDAQYAGRQIEDSFERGIALQFAENLKDELEASYKKVKVVITRFAGETLQHLQNANFANRLDVDLYLSVHFYKEKEIKPQIFLYTFSYNDDFITRNTDLFFYPYDQAHLINKDTTKIWANKIRDFFLQENDISFFDLRGLFRLPFKPLIAVKAPSIGVEIGLRKKDEWKEYIDVFGSMLGEIL